MSAVLPPHAVPFSSRDAIQLAPLGRVSLFIGETSRLSRWARSTAPVTSRMRRATCSRIVGHRNVAHAGQPDELGARDAFQQREAVALERDDPVSLRPDHPDRAVRVRGQVFQRVLRDHPQQRGDHGGVLHRPDRGRELGRVDAVGVFDLRREQQSPRPPPAGDRVRAVGLPGEQDERQPHPGGDGGHARRRPPRAGGAEQDDRPGPSAAGQLQGDPPAERVADDVRPLDPSSIELFGDPVGERVDGRGHARGEPLRSAVAGQGRCEHRVPALQQRQHRAPHPPGAADAVQEHQRRSGAAGVRGRHRNGLQHRLRRRASTGPPQQGDGSRPHRSEQSGPGEQPDQRCVGASALHQPSPWSSCPGATLSRPR